MSYCKIKPIKKPSIRYNEEKQKFEIIRRRKAVYQKTQMPTVDITHLQKFMKRVRKSNASKELKFYAVSEYGRESKRPHYHIILMGLDIVSFVGLDNWKLHLEGKLKFDGSASANCHIKDWKFGHINIGTCTPQSVAYTLKYISKGRVIPQYKGDKRQKEKSIMSKGIGISYLTEANKKLHREDLERQYAVTFDSKKIPLPRYLKDRLYDSLEREYMVNIYAGRYIQEILEMNDDKKLKKLELSKRVDIDRLEYKKIGKTDKL